MDASTWILAGITACAVLLALVNRPATVGESLRVSFRLVRGVAPELLLGFILAGLIDVLIPTQDLVAWLGRAAGIRAICAGWLVGLLLPGGPYVFFPIVATLSRQGVAPNVLLTLLTAKTLISPIRMLTYEAPLLGWPLTLSRLIPGLILPPLVGWIGGSLYDLFVRPST